MKHRTLAMICAVATTALLAGHALAQRKAPSVQQGLWDMLVTITDVSDLPRPPGVKPPMKGFQACLTQAQADDPITFISQTVAPIGPECRPGPLRQTGNRVSWPVQCPAPKSGPAASAAGAFEFSSGAMEGTMRLSRPIAPGKSADISLNIVGKRIGDC
jgi:hypothetical protein